MMNLWWEKEGTENRDKRGKAVDGFERQEFGGQSGGRRS